MRGERERKRAADSHPRRKSTTQSSGQRRRKRGLLGKLALASGASIVLGVAGLLTVQGHHYLSEIERYATENPTTSATMEIERAGNSICKATEYGRLVRWVSVVDRRDVERV